MNKHTKGPWLYRKSADNLHASVPSYVVYILDDKGDEQILTHGGCGCCSNHDESIDDEGDARLMAAAPDLLAMLGELLGAMEASGGWEGDDDLFDKGMAVVRKARGES